MLLLHSTIRVHSSMQHCHNRLSSYMLLLLRYPGVASLLLLHGCHCLLSPAYPPCSSITFPLACLAGVFVVVLHLLLVRDHHVGTLLLSATGLLGAVWAGIAAAGILVRAPGCCIAH
jgi:hypothetical protein